ncbi:DUF1775 domain-containing protein [Microcella alkaliphila]|uniref:DUF1775 domain-containing protein n=1 Tax=Microcella alkaliphila TaxID=279828 RepID=UPI000BBADABF|nr:DUF1775 domain-containing protein [Microcella alkaliphila]
MSTVRSSTPARASRLGMATAAVVAGAGLALAAPLSASAHVSASATSTAAGSYTVVAFSVPHGCEASPTEVVTISMPESVPSVTPTVNPNWSVEKQFEDAADPNRVTAVVYTAIAEPLAADLRDVFELSFRVPDDAEGESLEFPTVQTCTEGTAEWVGDDVPAFTVTAATGDAHGHGASETGAATDDDVFARVVGGGGLALGAGALGVSLWSVRRRATA